MANQHIDEVILSDLKEVMEADFNRLITVYFDDARLRLDQLQSLVQAGDLSELRKTAHSIKGSSSNIGAPRLAELLQKLEDMAKADALQNEFLLLNSIHDEFEQVKIEILKWMQSV